MGPEDHLQQYHEAWFSPTPAPGNLLGSLKQTRAGGRKYYPFLMSHISPHNWQNQQKQQQKPPGNASRHFKTTKSFLVCILPNRTACAQKELEFSAQIKSVPLGLILGAFAMSMLLWKGLWGFQQIPTPKELSLTDNHKPQS